jgi:hypothetical protein
MTDDRFDAARPRSPRRASLAAVTLSLALAAALPAARAQAEVPDASPAERLLFLNPHLAGTRTPTALRYEFVRADSTEAGSFTDRVEIRLARGKSTPCCSASGSFLSGARAINLPEIDDASANPVVMYMLEYDVRQLDRSYPGKSAYFRKRIRLALVDAATVAPTTIRWNGADVAATSVQFSPFVNDPNRARFERESRKSYTFVLSDAVPGRVYQIRTTLPAAAAGTNAVEETLTLLPPQDSPAKSR